ncbi:hypothetical protein LJC22_06920, partial [Desulfosarcina sp. OttesenSCG-928-G10]|nr:hypothetical protein [Desulfosarcina sp. OttesenSCG-928-G10]
MITLVANPSSRSGHGRRLWPFWQKALSRTGRPHAFLETTSYADCVDKAEQAARTGDTVVAVGGDGTLNAVISGVLQASETLPGPDFGVL